MTIYNSHYSQDSAINEMNAGLCTRQHHKAWESQWYLQIQLWIPQYPPPGQWISAAQPHSKVSEWGWSIKRPLTTSYSSAGLLDLNELSWCQLLLSECHNMLYKVIFVLLHKETYMSKEQIKYPLHLLKRLFYIVHLNIKITCYIWRGGEICFLFIKKEKFL
jgi:hypothetical protein